MAKWSRKCRDFLIYLLLSHMNSLPTESGRLFTTDKPTLTSHNHPKSIVCTTVHSRASTFYGFGQTYVWIWVWVWVWIHHHSVIQSISTALKVLCALPIDPYPSHYPPPTSGNNWSFQCLHGFAFSRTSYSWNGAMHSHFRLASFTPVFWPGEFQGLYSLWGRKE